MENDDAEVQTRVHGSRQQADGDEGEQREEGAVELAEEEQGSAKEEEQKEGEDDDPEDPHELSAAGFYGDAEAEAAAPSTVPSLPAPSIGVAVAAQAPVFPAVHRSWPAFDAQLKEYAQSTYQLYVVRTTTSVNRRNLRIAELAAGATTASAVSVDTSDAPEDADDSELTLQQPDDAGAGTSDRLMIPAHWKWYSKTMMCTHGWKDRHRGTGKRSMTMVRSTGCPVKMCITLQHTNETCEDGDGDGWRVVVTKHVRTHNHPLSKELYLFYTENRRIYDPELLALVGGNSPSGSSLAAEFYGAFGDDEDETGQASTTVAGISQEDAVAMDSSLPLMTPKAFNSWDNFHSTLVDYSLATQQHFRIRSTISAQSKNSKLMDQATKTSKSVQETAIHLVPEDQRWYSKLLICNHGWRRKSRSKMAKFQRRGAVDEWQDAYPNACPAMIMARLQRDIYNNWRIVINRQVVSHNHVLYTIEPSDGDNDARLPSGMVSDLEDASATTPALVEESIDRHQDALATEEDQQEEFVNAAVQHLEDLQLPDTSTRESALDQQEDQQALVDAMTIQSYEATLQSLEDIQPAPKPMSVVTEVVVRVAKLHGIHESWESFHECLQQYSEHTYQSYRTRTTSSVKGRNQKIFKMRAASDSANVRVGDNGEQVTAETTRLIPIEYKWYSKTLTCTHGWKERRRGAGKRTIHIVRSTLCPVKICATLQYIEPGVSTGVSEAGWRVVVTKHIVDHNHNLSKELYQHYCDNRRIYDPDLLTIDHSGTSAAAGNGNSAATTTLSGSTSRAMDSSSVVGMASSNEEPHPFFTAGSSVEFDHQESFGSHQHTLHGTAYMESEGSSASQTMSFSTTNGQPLMSYSSMMAPSSGIIQQTGSTAPGNTSTLAMHQAFDPNSGYASAVYAAMPMMDFGGMQLHGAPAGVTFNVLCQLHGPPSTSGRSPPAEAECTCLRVPVVHHYSASAAPVATSSSSDGGAQGKRCATSADRTDEAVPPASKRARQDMIETEAESASLRTTTDASISTTTTTMAPVALSTSTSSGPPPIWSSENPVQGFPVNDGDGVIVWRAPRLRRRHENWAEFTDHLNAYSESTFQLYRVRTTSSIAARNTRISQQLQQLHENGVVLEDSPDEEVVVPQLVPATYEWYSKTYVCTHGWKERRRGKGQRVSHNLRSTACPVKLCVTLQRDPHDTTNWNVVVTKHVLDHNHEISASVFHSYSENRRIRDPELLARAEQMWRDGQSRRKVFEFLKGATKSNILMKDVHNLVQRWQQQRQDEASATLSVANGEAVGDDRDHDRDHDVVDLIV